MAQTKDWLLRHFLWIIFYLFFAFVFFFWDFDIISAFVMALVPTTTLYWLELEWRKGWKR